MTNQVTNQAAVTLRTLESATAQQVFDQIVNHLRRQKVRAFKTDLCVYRSPDGLKCAAGCLIGDDEYSPGMEKLLWSQLVESGRVPSAHKELIIWMQEIHDNTEPYGWERSFSVAAQQLGLQYSEPKKAITLATLESATPQEVFDQVATHLLKQGQRAKDSSYVLCVYRSVIGLKCAAGCLIADDEYSPEMEGSSWKHNRHLQQYRTHQVLIAALQHLHDATSPARWYVGLRGIAEREELEFNHKEPT